MMGRKITHSHFWIILLSALFLFHKIPGATCSNRHHAHSRRKDLARKHLGIKADDSLENMLKAPLIHLSETTDDCEKSVFYEACIPALFGQGCTRFPVTGPCESQFCPRNCSGHGHCDERNLEASCACEAGFTGHFCATQLCPEDCSGHGRCHALYGTCDCDPGFGGPACADVLCPSNCTQPNGICDLQTGICTCQTGFSGVDCSQEPRQLYNESWGVVFALTLVGVCTIFIYLINLSKLRFLPDSISAIIIGAIIGLVVRFVGVNENRHLITVRPTSIFLFFLPMIMFESGYGLKKTSFFKNFPTILVFAVFGTVISAAVVGLGTYYLGVHGYVYKLSFLNSVVFGALLASTDPVATLAIFQALKVDSTLYMIAFGESVLNDAVAIVLFESILSQFYINQEHHSLAHFPIQFVFTFTASILIGVACALFAALTFKHLRLRELSTASLEISLMLVFSYMPYLLAASTRLSGIMAIFSAGIIMSHYTQWNLSEEARKVTSSMFRTLAFAAETFLFAYIGLSAVIFNYSNALSLAAWGLLLCVVGRALNIFPLALIVNQFRTNRISLKVQFVLWFSGLRGIISFALALNVPGADHDVIAAATLIIVIVTIVVFGGGTVPTLRALGMINEQDRVYVSKTAQEQERDALLRKDDKEGGPSTYGTDPEASAGGLGAGSSTPPSTLAGGSAPPLVGAALRRDGSAGSFTAGGGGGGEGEAGGGTPTLGARNWFERIDDKILLPLFRSDDAVVPPPPPDDEDH